MVARSLIFVPLLWCSCVAANAEMYKYENEDGVTVLDSHVPAKYVRDGYTVLSNDGRVLKVVPRAPTPAEREQAEREQLVEERRNQEERARRERDRTLMRLYSKPDDVKRARDSRLASIESTIETSRANLSRLRERKYSFEAQLANIERAGGTISQERLDRIEQVEERINDVKEEIEHKKQEKQKAREAFNKDLQRVRELYDDSAGDLAETPSKDRSS
ncbi:MAG: hypothetical protein WD356_01460 [Pseudomonadales bacterium]